MNGWLGIVVILAGYMVVVWAYCRGIDTTPTPGSDRDRDCPGVPGARAGCPDRDCRARAGGRHA